MELIPCALYEAQRMDNGKYITGALIHSPHSPFAYIATIKNMENMVVDELNEGIVSNLKLLRVMKKSIRLVDNETLKCNCGRNYEFDESKIVGHCDYCIEICKECGRQLDIEEYNEHDGKCYVCRYEDYIKDSDLYNISGIDNKILNNSREVIGTTINSHYTEGIVKSLNIYNECLDVLDIVRNSINDNELKSKITNLLEQAINL